MSYHGIVHEKDIHAWAHALSAYQQMSYARGLWNWCGRVSTFPDMSGQGNVLNVGGAGSTLPYGLMQQYIDMDGASRGPYAASAAWNNMTGSFDIHAWIWFDTFGANRCLGGKWNGLTANRQFMLLYESTSGTFRLQLSTDGILNPSHYVESSVTPETGKWYCMWGQFQSSTYLRIHVGYMNGSVPTLVTDESLVAPASIFSGAADFEFGSFNAGAGGMLDGRLAYGFLGQYNRSTAYIQMMFDLVRPAFGMI